MTLSSSAVISRADVLDEAKRQRARLRIGSVLLKSLPDWERFCVSATQAQMREAFDVLTGNERAGIGSMSRPMSSAWAREALTVPEVHVKPGNNPDQFDDRNDPDPLVRAPRVAATEHQLRVTILCLAHLKRRYGVSLRVFPSIEFHRPDYSHTEGRRGLAHFREPATYRIHLHTELWGRDLVYVLSHEIWHCVDIAAGRFQTMERALLEQRAVDFGMRAAESFSSEVGF